MIPIVLRILQEKAALAQRTHRNGRKPMISQAISEMLQLPRGDFALFCFFGKVGR
jgi:hypothetical protein